ncbi:hypothetical protein GQ44DRAFT_732619 [Phaeosphaeriaceae sp. PMI808]|nr:hypothetical protein GQ44DRAFT_732619 [Phaeosphaeriaceae sp. PMI808]
MTMTPHSSALPPSQTAPVVEFRCLFTHDFKRKQKRWQDGYLKFHTFNNRVMVSDQARNHIGDTYWKDSNELQEGDELTLDKGVMVEVAESMGTTQTDLTPLFDKKGKESAKEPAARPVPSSSMRPFQRPTSVAPSSAVRTGTQLRHKSLNTLLGPPRGPVGKAVPMKSPYEVRKENDMVEQASKRQKTVHLATVPDSMPVFLPHQTLVAKAITLSSEADPISVLPSGVKLLSPPTKAFRPTISAPVVQYDQPQELPSITTSKPPRTKIRLPGSKTIKTPKQPALPSPPVSTSNRLTNVEFAIQPAQKPQKLPSPQPTPPRNRKAKSLRLSAGVKRGTLLCQSISKQPPRIGHEHAASAPKQNAANTSRLQSLEPSAEVLRSSRGIMLDSPMLASRASPRSKQRRKSPIIGSEIALQTVKSPFSELDLSDDPFNDPEVVHGLMDQQLLIQSSPIQSSCAPSSPLFEAPMSKPALQSPTGNRSLEPQKRLQSQTTEAEYIQPRLPTPTRTKENGQSTKYTNVNDQAARTVSPPQVAILEPPLPPPRIISPRFIDISGARSRSTSTPPNKSALSTGGFEKKPKANSKQTTFANLPPELPIMEPRDETVVLPPYSLRGGKKGPLMSTTELASLLQKPRKRQRPANPIKDDAEPAYTSSARKIRRVRSENDAPIPSISSTWEKQNLPKTLSSNEAEVPRAPEPKKKVSTLAALVKRTDPRIKLARAQSLSVQTDLPCVDELPSPVVDNDVGPWSTDAFDLFDWRPPNWEENEGNVAE